MKKLGKHGYITKYLIISLILMFFIFSLKIPMKASEIDSFSENGDYYNENHTLFYEAFAAENYTFSENTMKVKNVLAEDNQNGYLGYPVNIRLNEIAPNEAKSLKVYSDSQGYSVEEFMNTDLYNELTEEEKESFIKYLEKYQAKITDIDYSIDTPSVDAPDIDGVDSFTIGDIYKNEVKGTFEQ